MLPTFMARPQFRVGLHNVALGVMLPEPAGPHALFIRNDEYVYMPICYWLRVTTHIDIYFINIHPRLETEWG